VYANGNGNNRQTQSMRNRDLFKFENQDDDMMEYADYGDDYEQWMDEEYYDDCNEEFNEESCEFIECEDWEIREDDNDCWREICYNDCGDEYCALWHLDSWNDAK